MIVALILSLTAGSFEIRQEGSFQSMEDCIQHMTWRMNQSDLRRGDTTITCVPITQVQEIVRHLFGSRA